MNEASRWRLEMARKIVPACTESGKVRAAMVAGSVARGFADHHSDVEIGIFWDELPTPAELRAVVERLNGTSWELDPYDAEEDVWYEEYCVGGLKIDLRHMRVARMDEQLGDVLERGDVSEERQQIIAAVQDGVPLHGGSLIA